MELTIDQKKAHGDILAFWDKGNDLLTLGGFAGTGKTTVIAEAVKTFTEKHKGKRPSIAFCAFTGKASSIMREKLIKADGFNEGSDYCGTIHGLIYDIQRDGAKIEWIRRTELPHDLIVIDEASMVPETIFNDLKEYGVPILAVGDHGQLPPVKDTFNLMESPEIRLEKIHRQAEGNPIIQMSMIARNEGEIPFKDFGEFVCKRHGSWRDLETLKLDNDVLVLCAANHTRVSVNKMFRRKKRCFSDKPIPGDKVICLKNNRRRHIFNGMTGVLESVENSGKHWYEVDIKFDGIAGDYTGEILKHQFNARKTYMEYQELDWQDIGDLFDFGYCLTVHKAQGSEANQVVVLEERLKFMNDDIWARWLYTAVTRSREKLLVIGA